MCKSRPCIIQACSGSSSILLCAACNRPANDSCRMWWPTQPAPTPCNHRSGPRLPTDTDPHTRNAALLQHAVCLAATQCGAGVLNVHPSSSTCEWGVDSRRVSRRGGQGGGAHFLSPMMWPPKKGAISTMICLYSTAAPSSIKILTISPPWGACQMQADGRRQTAALGGGLIAGGRGRAAAAPHVALNAQQRWTTVAGCMTGLH